MIFVTGDTHFPKDSKKLFQSKKGFALSKLQRTDIVIVLGDFGLFWDKKDKDFKSNLQKVENLPYEVLFLDGNHENHPWINDFPVVERYGGSVHRCGSNIYHLMRGEIYKIEGFNFFVCGGATSIDKGYRVPFVSWWPEENISAAEERKAVQNLDNAKEPIDFVLTHTCPDSIIVPMFNYNTFYDITSKFLDTIKDRLPSAQWYFGHWHEDKNYGRFHAVYNKIHRLV